MKKGKIAFVGSGIIGAGLAVNAMLNGHPTALYDTGDLDVVRKRIADIFDRLVDAEAYTRAQTDEAATLGIYTNSMEEAVRDAIFVQESAPERLDLKRAIYKEIQTIAGNQPVIGSSASNILPSDLQEGALYPDRILVGHPFNPSYLLPLLEIVAGRQTSQEAVDFTKEVYDSMGKVSVLCKKEVMGYLVQGINAAILQGAIKLVAEGIGSGEDIDKGLMYGPGLRLPGTGQLLTIGLGVDGGWRGLAQKYIGTEAPKEYLMVADDVEEEMANRPEALGNDVESIIKYRDKTIASILKLQHRL